MRRICIEENPVNDNSLLLEELLEKGQAIAQWNSEVLQIEPNVESRLWRNVDVQTKVVKMLENVVPFGLEMPLQSKFLPADVIMQNEIDSGELHPKSPMLVRMLQPVRESSMFMGGWRVQERSGLRESGDELLRSDKDTSSTDEM